MMNIFEEPLLTHPFFSDHIDKLMTLRTSVGVAVSGGPDSMALALLMHRFCKSRNIAMVALTVDHGLRKESLQEARWVHEELTSRGIVHEILTWAHEGGIIPTTRIQEQARIARHDLLWQACERHGILDLMTAHHLQDQVETFLMRLNKRSGLSGLSVMRHARDLPQGRRMLRPLLNLKKEDLCAFLNSEGVSWKNDASNENLMFERVRWRSAIGHLQQIVGFDFDNVGCSIERLQEEDNYLTQLAQNFLQSYGDGWSNELNLPCEEDSDNRCCCFDWIEFKMLHIVLQRRVLKLCARHYSSRYYMHGYDAFERVRLHINCDHFKGVTLSGLLFKRAKRNGNRVVEIMKEARKIK